MNTNDLGDGELKLTDLSIGFSINGMREFIKQLNLEAITKTQKELDEIGDIKNALISNWQGESRAKYLNSLMGGIDFMKQTLDTLETTLREQMAQVAENYIEQDQNMFDEVLQSTRE